MPPTRRSEALRLTEFRLELPMLAQMALTPGVSEVWRIVIEYADSAHPAQAADLTVGLPGGATTPATATLTVHYRRGTDRPTVLHFSIPPTRARTFTSGMRNLGFDRLVDMPDMPWHGAEIWLIGRGAGTFTRDLVLAPGSARGVYAQIVSLVRTHLAEAIRPAN